VFHYYFPVRIFPGPGEQCEGRLLIAPPITELLKQPVYRASVVCERFMEGEHRRWFKYVAVVPSSRVPIYFFHPRVKFAMGTNPMVYHNLTALGESGSLLPAFVFNSSSI